MKKTIIPILSVLAAFSAQSFAENTAKLYLDNNTDSYVYMGLLTPNSSYAPNSVLGWINPRSEVVTDAKAEWVTAPAFGINLEKGVSFGYMDGAGNVALCLQDYKFDRSIRATLTDSASSVVCEVTDVEQLPPESNIHFRVLNYNSQGPSADLMIFNPSDEKWKAIHNNLPSSFEASYSFLVNSRSIDPQIRPDGKYQFGMRVHGNEEVTPCGGPVTFEGSYSVVNNNGFCRISNW